MGNMNELFEKYVNDQCTDEELEILQEFVLSAENRSELEEMVKQFGEKVRKLKNLKNTPVSEKTRNSFDKIRNRIETSGTGHPGKSFTRILQAAMLLILALALPTLYYLNKQNPSSNATEIAWLEKETQKGQKSTITLKDGSNVVLNSESKLRFPETFEDTREVILEGEAFFMVRRNEEMPFIVRSGNLVTKVLGTSFNIKAYPQDKSIQVAVATGEVAVSEDLENQYSEPHILTPNDLASYDLTNQRIKIESKDIGELIAWREGVLKFTSVRFEEVIKTLERWYGMKIRLDNPNIGNCPVTFEAKNESLENVLKALEYMIRIEYEFLEEEVVLRGKGCQ